MTFTDAFDENTPSELPKESSFHQDTAGGLWDLRREVGVTTMHMAKTHQIRRAHLDHTANARALHPARYVHSRPPDVILRFCGSNHACNHWPMSNACRCCQRWCIHFVCQSICSSNSSLCCFVCCRWQVEVF